jgi:hypothetical protein
MKRFQYRAPVPLIGLALIGLALFAFTVFAGCQQDEAPEEPAAAAPAPRATTATPNTLTDAERAEGWQLLFDGNTISQWRGYKSDSLPSSWVVDDQAIYLGDEGDGGDIISRDQYGNFELQLDWKISEGGNSGIMYRVTEDQNNTYHTGPEMQVLDNEKHPDARNGLDRTAGANYALHEPPRDVTKPVGEWNHARLVVDGAHVEHWLNGEKLVEYELWGDDWKARVAASKFNAWPSYGMNQAGHIALQDHGDPVWYRNIKVKPLPATD